MATAPANCATPRPMPRSSPCGPRRGTWAITAWTAALPEDEDDGFYGIEVDAHLAWTPTPNFTLESSVGLFNPGKMVKIFCVSILYKVN